LNYVWLDVLCQTTITEVAAPKKEFDVFIKFVFNVAEDLRKKETFSYNPHMHHTAFTNDWGFDT
jgi:hypothetical protein